MSGLGQISNAVNWSVANPCYGADFVGPMPSGSQICVNSAGQLLNSNGTPVTDVATPTTLSPGAQGTDYTYLIYAAFGLIGLLLVVKMLK